MGVWRFKTRRRLPSWEINRKCTRAPSRADSLEGGVESNYLRAFSLGLLQFFFFFYLLPEFVSLNVSEWFCRQPQPCANARCWEFNHNKPAKRLKVWQLDPRWWFSSIEFIGQYVVKHTSAVASKLGDESACIPRTKTRHSRRHFNTNWDNDFHCKCQATCVWPVSLCETLGWLRGWGKWSQEVEYQWM